MKEKLIGILFIIMILVLIIGIPVVKYMVWRNLHPTASGWLWLFSN